MRSFLMRVALALLVSSAVLPGSAAAGSNAGGTAFLSWDRAGADSIHRATPIAPFALFLHLRDAPDVRALAVKVTWTTNMADRPPCYAIVSSPPPEAAAHPDSLFGWAVDEHPGASFRGDSSYWQSIRFPAGSSKRNCVRYLVSSAGCDAPTFAMFEAATVVVEDGLGQVDTLVATTGARILPAPLAPLMVDDVYPRELPTRKRTALELRGNGFEAGTRVYLGRGGQLIQADEVVVLDSTTVRAKVTPWFGAGLSLDVVVDHPLKPELVVTSGVMESATAQTGQQSRPSNEGLPFRQIDPMDPTRTESIYGWPVAHNVSQNWGLTDSLMLATRANGAAAALIHSHPQHGIGLPFDGAWPAWVRYTIDPPMYATSLGTLLQGGHVYDGAGSFADDGKRLAIAKLTFEGGIPGPVIEYRVGTHVRNWTAGGVHFPPAPYDSVNFWPYFTTRPTDTLVCELLPGAGSTHFDFQEVRLPGAYRNRKVASVTFEATSDLYRTSPWWAGAYHGTGGLFGAALWPDFEITSREDSVVPLSRQFDAAWKDSAYGGFYRGSRLFGTRRTIGRNGCNLTCYVMAHQYFGINTTPNELNRYLQLNGGYSPEIFATVTGVTDSTIEYRLSASARRPIGDTVFVLARDRAKAILAAVVTDSSTIWTARVVRVIRPDLPALPGSAVGTFGLINPSVASRRYSNGKWTLQTLRTDSLAAADVELALTDSVPVFLRVRNKRHFVLATGWRPLFGDSARALATYTINDPGYAISLLSHQQYRNTFEEPRRCVPLPSAPPPAPAQRSSASAQSGQTSGSMVVVVQGGSRVQLVDPAGRLLRFDAERGRYLSEDADLIALHAEQIDDEEDSTMVSDPAEIISIAAPTSGDYLLTVRSDADAELRLYAAALDDTAGVEGMIDISPVAAGTQVRYRLSYSGSVPPSVALSLLGTTEAEPNAAVPRGLRLVVISNPSRGQIELNCIGGTNDRINWEVFDVRGRRVHTEDVPAGSQSAVRLKWGGPEGGLGASAPGLYFVRARRGDASAVTRVALVR